MGCFFLALMGVLTVSVVTAHYQLYSLYMPYHYPYTLYSQPQPQVQPQVQLQSQPLPHPAVFAPPVPTQRHREPSVSPLIHNSITYRVDPQAGPDDALEVAQFHSQDSAGRVVFGFNTPDQTRMEARALDGTVRGSYSYQDPTGRTVKMHYWDDGNGFHAMGNNVPFTRPAYTPEVQAARDQHFELYRQALAAVLAAGPGSEIGEPETEGIDSSIAVDMESADGPVADQVSGTAEKFDVIQPDYDEDSDAVEIASADFTPLRKESNKRKEPEADRKQVAEATDLTLDSPSNLAISQTGSDGLQRLVPVAEAPQGHSESQHATLYGAIPVDAVHDTQVSPTQKDSLENHQLKPVLIKTGQDESS